jgi:hypothetical protein
MGGSVRSKRTKKTMSGQKKSPMRKSGPSKMKAGQMESSMDYNQDALWKTYRELHMRVDRALDKLRSHFEDRVSPTELLKDERNLLLLLGECNYMVRCLREAERRR